MPGKIIIYCGNGDGKTTAALGHVVRFAGYGKKVAIICFMKGRVSGEVKFLRKNKLIDLHLSGLRDFLVGRKNFDRHLKMAKKGFDLAEKIISQQKKDVLILDEILYAVKYKLVDEKELISLLKKRKKIHLILTGGTVSKRLIKLADIVSKINKIKHLYDKTKKTIKGFDY